MNVLFLVLGNNTKFCSSSLYMDLALEFIKRGHFVTLLEGYQKRDWKGKPKGEPDYYVYEDKGEIIRVRIQTVTQVDNFVVKGMNLLRMIPVFKAAVGKAMAKRRYQLMISQSPPVTLYGGLQTGKKRQGTYNYLLLKDIWPYDFMLNGVCKPTGWKMLAFRYVAYLARKIYKASDMIGCMSPSNIKFLTDNEPLLDKNKIEVNPNSRIPFVVSLSEDEKLALRKRYGIPEGKVVLVYGGNLGIPQGIDFALESVEASQSVENAFFVFVGGGTERTKIERFQVEKKPRNFLLLPMMPRTEYETLLFACDVGLVYLNHEQKCPDFPSRLLSYMQASLPVLFATGVHTDIGQIAESNGYGLWCESDNARTFADKVRLICDDEDGRKAMGNRSYHYLMGNYTVETSYEIIMSHLHTKK